MLARRFREVDVDVHREGAPELEPNVPDGPVVIYDEQTEEPVIAVARYPTALMGNLRRAFTKYRERAATIGSVTVSRTGGSRTDTTSFGYQAMQPLLRRTSCRTCGGAQTAPHAHATMCDAATVLGELLTSLLPRRAEQDANRAGAEIRGEWLLGDGWWTSGVLNYNSPITYHRDANNMACWSAMVVARRGMRGGHLHVPEYDVVLPCRDGDVLFFPGYDLLHAVTPMRKAQRDAYRMTAVYYTVEKMRRCGAAVEQLSISQERRTRTETDLINRQRADGYLNR